MYGTMIQVKGDKTSNFNNFEGIQLYTECPTTTPKAPGNGFIVYLMRLNGWVPPHWSSWVPTSTSWESLHAKCTVTTFRAFEMQCLYQVIVWACLWQRTTKRKPTVARVAGFLRCVTLSWCWSCMVMRPWMPLGEDRSQALSIRLRPILRAAELFRPRTRLGLKGFR